MSASTFLKSQRLPSSRLAWSTALVTSCISISETMSKEGIVVVLPRPPGGILWRRFQFRMLKTAKAYQERRLIASDNGLVRSRQTMPNLDLPILVVDDAKFSSMVVGRTLRNAGYRDIRIANNAPAALKLMEERAVSVLIADWLMPEMDGLELTDRVRQQDEQDNHYTYVILLTARESVEALSEAFDRGVDDFIYKSDMTKQLIPRIFAADRMAD